MKPIRIDRILIACLFAGTASFGTAALAQGPHAGHGPGYGMGPEMMGGYGPGGGSGMGPGMMMSGYGPGGCAMGAGMMAGHGWGGGMMGGMMGAGMGYGMLHRLSLTPEQWDKVSAIHEDLAKKTWDLTGKTREEMFKLRGLMNAEKRDRNAIAGQYKKFQDLRLQGFQARLDAQEKIDGVLTKEQREQRRRFAPWWAQEVLE